MQIDRMFRSIRRRMVVESSTAPGRRRMCSGLSGSSTVAARVIPGAARSIDSLSIRPELLGKSGYRLGRGSAWAARAAAARAPAAVVGSAVLGPPPLAATTLPAPAAREGQAVRSAHRRAALNAPPPPVHPDGGTAPG